MRWYVRWYIKTFVIKPYHLLRSFGAGLDVTRLRLGFIEQYINHEISIGCFVLNLLAQTRRKKLTCVFFISGVWIGCVQRIVLIRASGVQNEQERARSCSRGSGRYGLAVGEFHSACMLRCLSWKSTYDMTCAGMTLRLG